LKIKKTWLTAYFTHGSASVEVTLNYQTGAYDIKQNGEEGVRFRSKYANTPLVAIEINIDRAKCVMAALRFIKGELNNKK
jgi:hypothetical protein